MILNSEKSGEGYKYVGPDFKGMLSYIFGKDKNDTTNLSQNNKFSGADTYTAAGGDPDASGDSILDEMQNESETTPEKWNWGQNVDQDLGYAGAKSLMWLYNKIRNKRLSSRKSKSPDREITTPISGDGGAVSGESGGGTGGDAGDEYVVGDQPWSRTSGKWSWWW